MGLSVSVVYGRNPLRKKPPSLKTAGRKKPPFIVCIRGRNPLASFAKAEQTPFEFSDRRNKPPSIAEQTPFQTI
ncbi:hypothetical protein DPMN_153436 [Dreissena polymorpha]|uniref:Uncharacterized protein n=1 Tax=Dreissena polymorpha TaxID=45954 RepID=A0A9D4J631_DREPO|nr:hypothetical protein DPMN_153436 [Dreissena polymorpha]